MAASYPDSHKGGNTPLKPENDTTWLPDVDPREPVPYSVDPDAIHQDQQKETVQVQGKKGEDLSREHAADGVSDQDVRSEQAPGDDETLGVPVHEVEPVVLDDMAARQQQVLQTLSDVSKTLHDTAQSTFRKPVSDMPDDPGTRDLSGLEPTQVGPPSADVSGNAISELSDVGPSDVLETQADLLGIQSDMQRESRLFQSVGNVIDSKRDASNAKIHNVRPAPEGSNGTGTESELTPDQVQEDFKAVVDEIAATGIPVDADSLVEVFLQAEYAAATGSPLQEDDAALLAGYRASARDSETPGFQPPDEGIAENLRSDKEADQRVADRPSETGGTEPPTQPGLKVELETTRPKQTPDTGFGSMDEEEATRAGETAADVATGADGAAAPFIPGGGVLGAVMGGRGTENLAASSGNSDEDDPPDAGPLPEAADPTGRGTIGAPAEQPEVRIPGARDDDDGGGEEEAQESQEESRQTMSNLTREMHDTATATIGNMKSDPEAESGGYGETTPGSAADPSDEPLGADSLPPPPHGEEPSPLDDGSAPMTLEEAMQEQSDPSDLSADDYVDVDPAGGVDIDRPGAELVDPPRPEFEIGANDDVGSGGSVEEVGAEEADFEG